MEPGTSPMENLDLLPDEILLQIMLEMTDLRTLNSWCLTSYRAANLCRDEGFWKQKYQKDYPETPSLPNVPSWKIDGDRSTSNGRQSVPSWKEKYEFIHSGQRSSPISAGSHHYAVIDDQGMLYMGGDNTRSQWGLGHEKNLGELSAVSPFKQRVRSVSCGHNHTFAVTEDGNLHFWGVDFHNSLFPKISIHLKPKQINIPGKAIKVSCGPKNNNESDVIFAVIMENHFVYFRYYIFFSDIKSDNIIESPNYDFHESKMIEGTIPIKAVDISVEGSFGLVSTEGKLYFWGSDLEGTATELENTELVGIKMIKNKIVIDPVHIPLPEPIKQVAHGGTYIGTLSINGNIYLWGSNYYGQLGQMFDRDGNIRDDNFRIDRSKNFNFHDLFIYQPQKLKLPCPIAFLSCQMNTTSAINTNGKLYMWGKNIEGSIFNHNMVKKISGVVLNNHEKESLRRPVQIEIGSILSILPSDAGISSPDTLKKDISFIYVSVGSDFNITTTNDGMVNLWRNT